MKLPLRCPAVLGTIAALCLVAGTAVAEPRHPSTFSIVGADPEAGELGVAVASRFFAVGSVVPHARAGAGAVATQSYANTSYGPRGLDLLARGVNPGEALGVLTRNDEQRDRRQVGIVSADGASVTYTGPGCNAWAGGRSGPGYAIQGNILTGEDVVAAMETAWLASQGQPLARRLFDALKAGDAAGGDSRGRQSAAVLVVRHGAGYGGFTDQAVDVRVDDHEDPFGEMERLVRMGIVNDQWNRGWTLFRNGEFAEALVWQERTTTGAADLPGMLPEVLYDLAVIRLAAGQREDAVEALERAIALNPKLRAQADSDDDLAALREGPAAIEH